VEKPDPVRAFAMQARDYCSFIESTSNGQTPRAFARECLMHLASLYQLALRLPKVAPASHEEWRSIPQDELFAMMKSIANRLPHDYYWHVFEPLEMDCEAPSLGSLVDDLADTWQDLKPGVEWMAAHDGMDSLPDGIIWCWRWTFEFHWGRHTSGAMAILHPICFGMPGDPDEEDSGSP